MRIPLAWLREYVRVDATAQQMADALYHTIVRAETAPLRARITAP